MKKLFLFLVAMVLVSQGIIAQKNTDLSPAEFEAYNKKRLAETDEQHRMAKTYFNPSAFEELYTSVAKKANVSASDNKAFHDMISEFYFHSDRAVILKKINKNELNDANVLAYKQGKIDEYASYYQGAFLQGKTTLLGTSASGADPLISQRFQSTNGNMSLSCGNIDFDLGSYSGWFGSNYNISSAFNCGLSTPNPMPNVGFNFTGMNVTSDEHGLCNAGVDPSTAALPTVSPFTAGGTSCRLGDVTDGCGASQMSFSFTVSSSNINFTYDYAAILYDGHLAADAPKIIIGMVDLSTGNSIISCASYSIDATQAANPSSGYIPLGGGLYYRPWSQVFVSLSPYVGKNVQVNILTSDCDGTAHRGYCYFDFHCSPFFFTMTPGSACTGNSATLSAPGGAATYTWTTLGSGTIAGPTNQQTITATSSGDYQVTMTALGSGCSYTIDTIINVGPPPIPSVSFTTTPVCAGTAMQFTDVSVTNGAPPFTSWNWNFGNGGSSTSQNPSNVYMTPGTFTVSFTANDGCNYTYSTTVTVYPNPTVTATSSVVCTGTPPVTLAASGAATYTWNTGATGSNITVIGPTATTVYTVTGSTINSCTAAVTATVTVNASPTVTVNNATICDGTGPVTLTAAGAATYTWDSGATGSTLSTNPSVTTNYTVTGSTVAGCTNAATTSITIIPNPTITINNAQICSGATANISASGAVTYTWTGLNLINNTGANVSANPPVTATYTVIGTANTCNTTAIATITVLPTPSVTVANQGPYCPGDAVPAPSFTSNPNDPATTFTWLNNFPAIGLTGGGSGTPPAFTASPNSTLATITGTVTVTPELNGCIGLPAPYIIIIKPTPFVNHIPSVEYCPNKNTLGVNVTSIPGGPTTYDWINTNNAIGLASSGSGNIPSFVTTNTGNSVVSGIVHVVPTLNGCVGPDSTYVITVNPLPDPKFKYSRACLGDATHLTDESSIGTGTITAWAWDFNNDGIFLDATNTNPQTILTPAGPHQIGLTVTSNKGCKNAVYETVYVNPLPSANFIGDNLMGCPIHPVVFTDLSSSTSPQNIISWFWQFGNGQTSSAQFPTVVNYNNQNHINLAFYSVTLTVKTDSGCSASFTRPNYVTVYPRPLAGFTWGPSDVDILDPSVQFYNTSIGGSGNLPLHYYLGDTYIDQFDTANWSNLNNPRHRYKEDIATTYYVTQWVQNIYGCKDSVTNPVVINPVYTFYIPNAFSPNGDGHNEGFKGTGINIDPETYHLWVFDRWGNQCFHSQNLEETWNGRVNEKLVQEDVYVWKVRFMDMGGTKHELHGHVSLIK